MTLWNTVAFAIVLVAFGILVYGLLRRTHLQQVDRSLASRLEDLQQLVGGDREPEPQLRRWIKSIQKHSSLTGLILDSQRSFGSA